MRVELTGLRRDEKT